MVHNAAQAGAALAVAGTAGATLLSAPGAAGSLGCAWFLAITSQAAASHPGVPHRVMLDCADATGHALAALRAGLRWLVLHPAPPGFATLAAGLGAVVLPRAPPALDLARVDLRNEIGMKLLAQWLCGTPDDTRKLNG